MTAILSAMINGAIVGALVTATIWVAMLVASRRLNAEGDERALAWVTRRSFTHCHTFWPGRNR